MNPMVAVTALFAAASAAPAANYGLAGTIAAPGLAAAPVAVAGGYAAAPLAAAPLAVGAYAAPVAAVAAAPAISLPAPYTTSKTGPAAVSVHQPPAQITKQLHYADQTYVAGYNTRVLKPAIPDFKIAVPTALKGTVQYTAPEVAVRKEPFVVNEPYHVDKPYNVPYEVIKNVEKIVEVPQPVHVQKPYAVPVPVAVRGQDIVKVTQGAPIVRHTHHTQVAPAIVQQTGYAAAGLLHGAPALAAAPAAIAGHHY